MALKKQLPTPDVFSLAAGAMISSGLFVLPAIFSQLELATALPRARGTYFFIERILGTPAGACLVFTLLNLFSVKSSGRA